MNLCKCVLVLSVLVAHMVVATSAVKCYICSSKKDGDCGDPFNVDDKVTCDGGVCVKVISPDKGLARTYQYGCVQSEC